MPTITDAFCTGNIELVNAFGTREITHVVHDIDGTHSLIRDWPPVMGLSMLWGMTCGLTDDFDSEENFQKLVKRVGNENLGEMDDVCRFFNGYSAITQLEYGIRRGFQEGNYPDSLTLSDTDKKYNNSILDRLRSGQERYDDIPERDEVRNFIDARTPRFFKFYERLLNEACRNKNTADAWINPEKWRVPGGLEFMNYLHNLGIVNYFVTGAVVFEEGGMFEEVQACGYDIGPDKQVEALIGSSWDKKLPKDEVISDLFAKTGMKPETTLILGDGRTEIAAGAGMGCVCISRLDANDTRQRKLHADLGTHIILPDYTEPALQKIIS